jgi:Arc/MetJ family transcription regulator
MEALMSKSYIDLDDEALATVAAHYRTGSKSETVNHALREIAARARRAAALEELVAMADEGVFDILLDKKNYRR